MLSNRCIPGFCARDTLSPSVVTVARKTRSRLLGLAGLHLLFEPALGGLGSGLGVQAVVPPAEAGGVVADELLVVNIVVVGASPERQEVTQAPGEVVAAVGIDSLEEAEGDPDVHGDHVEITGDLKQDDWATDDAEAEEHGLDGGGVLSSETERSRVCVVHLVDVLVKRAVVKRAVEPVVPGVLHSEDDGDLPSHLPERREGNAMLDAEVGGDGVEEPDLGELGGEVADEDDEGTIPLLLEGGHLLGLKLVLLEVGDVVGDHEGDAAAEIDGFVKNEAHDASREDIVLHVKVPCLSRFV